jgi:hypothetical protein
MTGPEAEQRKESHRPATLKSQGILPDLPLKDWQDTATSLHLWTQIVGKIRLQLSPMLNHWWQTTLYLTSRGLTTSPMPAGNETVQIDFEFIEHVLQIQNNSGAVRTLNLAARPVADFYHEMMDGLQSLGVQVDIWTVPVEMEEQVPFEQDKIHTAYDPEYAHRFWEILFHVDRVMKEFRSRFKGKASPVHFFWGSFDLNATRYSGREAPAMNSAFHVAKYVMQEAYANEVSSCGFWPGEGLGEPAFYAYNYPEPPGYADSPIQPAQAYYHPNLKEFILPYEAVRTSITWEDDLLSFFQSTYEVGANLAKWDRATLERSFLVPPTAR